MIRGRWSGPARSFSSVWCWRSSSQVCAAHVSRHPTLFAWAETETPDCRPVEVPVAAHGGEAARDARLVGQVCYPTTGNDAVNGAVQVLVSGTAYGRSYWDFPYQPDTYSYVRAAARAGFTTFNFDRIGNWPEHPPAQHSGDDSVQRVPQSTRPSRKLRSGTVDDVRYGKGGDRRPFARVADSRCTKAATYHDVDAVIASGILHTFDPLGVTKIRRDSVSGRSRSAVSWRHHRPWLPDDSARHAREVLLLRGPENGSPRHRHRRGAQGDGPPCSRRAVCVPRGAPRRPAAVDQACLRTDPAGVVRRSGVLRCLRKAHATSRCRSCRWLASTTRCCAGGRTI